MFSLWWALLSNYLLLLTGEDAAPQDGREESRWTPLTWRQKTKSDTLTAHSWKSVQEEESEIFSGVRQNKEDSWSRCLMWIEPIKPNAFSENMMRSQQKAEGRRFNAMQAQQRTDQQMFMQPWKSFWRICRNCSTLSFTRLYDCSKVKEGKMLHIITCVVYINIVLYFLFQSSVINCL